MKEEKLNQILEEPELQIAECFHQQQRLSEKEIKEMEYIKDEINSNHCMQYKINVMKSMMERLVDYQARWEQEQSKIDFAKNMYEMYKEMKGDDNE